MKRTIGVAFTLMSIFAYGVLFVAGSGCGDSRESLADETMSVMEEMVATLQGVKDEASAKAAKPKLEDLAKRFDDINQRESKLPAPTDEQTKALIEKHGSKMDELSRKLQGEMLRIAFDPKIQSVLGDVDFEAIH